jgi:hypothetical protein
MKKNILVRLTLAAGMVLVGGSAAAEGKGIPGTVCFEQPGTPAASYSHGSVYNATLGSMTVSCPLLRDEATFDDAHIMVWRNSTFSPGTNPVSCTVYMESLSGSFLSQDSSTESTNTNPSPNAFQSLHIGIPLITQEYYYAECTLPPTSAGAFSHIASFTIHEN